MGRHGQSSRPQGSKVCFPLDHPQVRCQYPLSFLTQSPHPRPLPLLTPTVSRDCKSASFQTVSGPTECSVQRLALCVSLLQPAPPYFPLHCRPLPLSPFLLLLLVPPFFYPSSLFLRPKAAPSSTRAVLRSVSCPILPGAAVPAVRLVIPLTADAQQSPPAPAHPPESRSTAEVTLS